MRIGILGSGLMGSKLGTILARAGHQVVFSYSRSQAKLQRLAKEAGGRARAGTPAEAVSEADAVLLAVHWSRVDDVLAPAGSLARKTVVTCSLPMTKNDSRMVLGLTTSGAETLAARLRRTNVVSAFSTAPSEVFLSVRESKAEDPAGPCILREPEGREEDRGETDPRCRLHPVDLGDLTGARYIGPFSLLIAEIVYKGSERGELAYRFEHLGRRDPSKRN